MSFNGDESESVTLSNAATWTAAFRSANPNAIKGHFFGKNKINDILNQSGCVGIRIYNGIDNGTPVLILVGVTSNENDMTSGTIIERAVLCPPYCGTGNSLNGNTSGPPMG
jgi:hypothetical protein